MISIPDFSFSHPYYLLFLELVPVMLILYFRNYRKQRSVIQISSLGGFRTYKKTFRQKLIHLPFILRVIGISFIIIAMADPKTVSYDLVRDSSPTESIILIDISQNSLAKDLSPNRLGSLKISLDHYLDSHLGNSYGIVTLGRQTNTLVPITDDIQTLKNSIENLEPEFCDPINLSQGLELGLEGFEDSQSKHKQILIFLSGNPNISEPFFDEALKIKQKGISIYPTILASEGFALYPVSSLRPNRFTLQVIQVDEKPLLDIAAISGGSLFRSRNNTELDQNFLKVNDEIEKIQTKKNPNYSGILPFAILASFLLILEILLRYTYLKSLP